MSGIEATAALVTQGRRRRGLTGAAAALACAGSDADRAGLLIELSDSRRPRPTPVASEAARRLEARLADHIPDGAAVARGRLCHLTLPAGPAGLDLIPAALPMARDSIGVIHLSPSLLQPALESGAVGAGSILLRADLDRDRALTALAVRALLESGLRVVVPKRRLAWIPSRVALLGALPPDAAGGLPGPLVRRLLSTRMGTDSDRGFLLSGDTAEAIPAGAWSDRASDRERSVQAEAIPPGRRHAMSRRP